MENLILPFIGFLISVILGFLIFKFIKYYSKSTNDLNIEIFDTLSKVKNLGIQQDLDLANMYWDKCRKDLDLADKKIEKLEAEIRELKK